MEGRGNRMLVAGLAAATAAGGCATLESAGPVPESFAFNREFRGSRHGYSFRAAYFTAAEERDARWEAWRRRAAREMQVCPNGHRLLRRDVRWYPATPLSGRRCAAIVYTVQCRSHDPRMAWTLAEDRRLSLRTEEPPIQPDCGDKYQREGRLERPDQAVTGPYLSSMSAVQ
jgi:hypothetical protein